MKILLMAFLLQGSAAASAPSQQCALRVEFGSCCGTDAKLARDIGLLLKARPHLAVEPLVGFRGIEGEHGLCVQTASSAKAREAYDAIRALVPKYTKDPPTTVRLASGESFGSMWPPTAQLVRTPSLAAMEKAFPDAARRRGVTWGSAILDCSVMSSGHFKDCRVHNEFPDGVGFGAAALRLSKYYKLVFPPGAEHITRTQISVRLPPIH
jgi:hypothetical protein